VAGVQFADKALRFKSGAEGGGGGGGTDLKKKGEDLQNSGEIVGLVLDSRGIGEEVDAEEGGTHEQHWHEPGGVVALGVGATGGGEEPVGGGLGLGVWTNGMRGKNLRPKPGSHWPHKIPVLWLLSAQGAVHDVVLLLP